MAAGEQEGRGVLSTVEGKADQDRCRTDLFFNHAVKRILYSELE